MMVFWACWFTAFGDASVDFGHLLILESESFLPFHFGAKQLLGFGVVSLRDSVVETQKNKSVRSASGFPAGKCQQFFNNPKFWNHVEPLK